ncbi:MAG: NAD-dependent epimerase/dehydratase family protein [Anaerolineae bacterium]
MQSRELPNPVFVTGGAGFMGRRLLWFLLDEGCDVAAFVLPGEGDLLPEAVRIYEGDITDAEAVSEAVLDASPKSVFHLAAVGLTRPGLAMTRACRVNVGGLINLLEAIRTLRHVRRVVLVGSSYAYGARRSDDGLDPFNAYSASKVAAWAFARAAYNAWGLPIAWVRPFQVYGPGQQASALIPAAIEAGLQGEDFRMTGGKQQRDFVYVDDVVRGLIDAGKARGVEGRVLDLGTGQLLSVREVVEKIWDLTAAEGHILAGALPYRPGEVPAIPANFRRTRLLMGWTATVSLDEGLRRTVDVARAHHHELMDQRDNGLA